MSQICISCELQLRSVQKKFRETHNGHAGLNKMLHHAQVAWWKLDEAVGMRFITVMDVSI